MANQYLRCCFFDANNTFNRITLSGIIDLSHDWVSYYIKHAFSESRWASLTNTQTLQLAELTHKSDNIFDNVIKVNNCLG